MSDPRLDALAESARNRGLKLVRSRVRTPGKRRFGKVGLTDKTGKPVLGMDSKGPLATPEEVEDYLRSAGAQDWGASLDEPNRPRGKAAKPKPQPANDPAPRTKTRPVARPKPAPKPKPKSKPKLEIRRARPTDAPAILKLILFLGHQIDEKGVRRNLTRLAKIDETPFVATLDRTVVGLCGVHRTLTPHRPAPLGRVSILVVSEEVQGQGIGRMLVEAAEQWMRDHGCEMVEVTSNDRRAEAHAFYRHLGYERTSMRFVKRL